MNAVNIINVLKSAPEVKLFTQFGSNMFHQGHLRYTMDLVCYKNL